MKEALRSRLLLVPRISWKIHLILKMISEVILICQTLIANFSIRTNTVRVSVQNDPR